MCGFWQAYKRALYLPIIPVVWGIMSVVCVIAGPFGTQHLSPLARLAFWPVTIAASILIGSALRVFVRECLSFRRYWPEAPLIAVLAATVLSPFLAWLVGLFTKDAAAPTVLELFAYVFVVSLAISSFRHLLAVQAMPETVVAEGVEAAPIPAQRLMNRLEPPRRGRLTRLQVRDHYVDVVTDKGTTSLLMRLADAIAETEGVEGLRVHRSHWVALAAVRGQMRAEGKPVLVMEDGALAPVSRANAAQVQALDLPLLELAPAAPKARAKAATAMAAQ